MKKKYKFIIILQIMVLLVTSIGVKDVLHADGSDTVSTNGGIKSDVVEETQEDKDNSVIKDESIDNTTELQDKKKVTEESKTLNNDETVDIPKKEDATASVQKSANSSVDKLLNTAQAEFKVAAGASPIAEANEGFLAIELSTEGGDGSFNPLSKERVVAIRYQPNAAVIDKPVSLKITGFRDSGLKAVAPIVKAPITSAYVNAAGDIEIYFDKMSGTRSVEFYCLLELEKGSGNESLFTNHVVTEGENAYFKGLTIKEHVDGIEGKTATSRVPLNYEISKKDLQITPNSGSGINDTYNDYPNERVDRKAMFLYTSGENVEKVGGGWLNKEAEYILCNTGSPRNIKNYKLEIPLPPNVKFVASDYSSGKDGIKITGSIGSDYFTLEYSKTAEIPESISFTMQLDYTSLPTEGGAEKYGLLQWHDFWSNNRTGEYGIASRDQTGKPWKFSGEVFGIKQKLQFYDRAVLGLGTLLDEYGKGSSVVTKHEYKYSKRMEDFIINRQFGWPEPSYNFKTPFSALFYEKQTNFRRNTFEFSEFIQVKSMNIYSPGRIQMPGDMKELIVTFYSSNKKMQKVIRKEIKSEEIMVPFPLEKGEYINKITIDIRRFGDVAFNFTADLSATDSEGNELAEGTTGTVKSSAETVAYDESGELVSYGKQYIGEFMGGQQKIESEKKVIYTKPVAIAPNVDDNQKWNSKGANHEKYRYVPGKKYKDINLIKIDNKGIADAEGTKVNKDIVNFKTNDIKYSLEGTGDEINLVYQMLNKGILTLNIEGYKTSNLTDFRLKYTTVKGVSGEVFVPKDKLVLEKGKATYKIKLNIPEGDQVYSLAYELSSLPIFAEVNLSLDEMEIDSEFLPSRNEIKNLPIRGPYGIKSDVVWARDSYGYSYATSEYPSQTRFVSVPEAGEGRESKTYLAYHIGMGFGNIRYFVDGPKSRPTMFPGDKTTLTFGLGDYAYNPTYGFEINKNFNYEVGSFKGKYKNFKIVEEWIPGFFKESGNGLLRIRFIGNRADEAFNLYPVKNNSRDCRDPRYSTGIVTNEFTEVFSIVLSAKNQATMGKYALVDKIYRSDIWAKENLVGKKFKIVDSVEQFAGNPFDFSSILDPDKIGNASATFTFSELKIRDIYADAGTTNYIDDVKDIDGDGKTDTKIIVMPANYYDNNGGVIQEITRQNETNITTYLVDKKTGNELRDVKLYPHQEVDFVQSMKIIGDKNGEEFIGYYHIPKKDHYIDYVDAGGVIQQKKSEFDTYLTSFITTTAGGAEIPSDRGFEVLYFISSDPTNLSDGHNDMAELKEWGKHEEGYLTEEEVKNEALAKGKSYQDILANCTMVKIRSRTIDVNTEIISKTSLKIGHSQTENATTMPVDYFSGTYKFKVGASQINSTTPVMKMQMMPYKISGSVFDDKDADSLKNALENGIEKIDVQLWKTGVDPHDGSPVVDDYKETKTTDINGDFSFIVASHGEYYLKITTPKGKKLSIPKKSGGYIEDQSVFVAESGTDYSKVNFTLNDSSFDYQNAGFVDKRELVVPDDIYISVGESKELSYQIKPDYLMYDDDYKISPTLISEPANNEYFDVDSVALKFTGKKEGVKNVKVTIPDAPLDGTTVIEKTIKIHVEPASVGSVSVPTKAEIYAIKDKDNEVIAPILSIYNYGIEPVNAAIKGIDLNNTGFRKHLKLKEYKTSEGSKYAEDEISLRVIPIVKENPFARFLETDVTTIAFTNGGLPLGKLDGFAGSMNGQFTFDGKYSKDIISTNLEDNKFIMSYRFTKVVTP